MLTAFRYSELLSGIPRQLRLAAQPILRADEHTALVSTGVSSCISSSSCMAMGCSAQSSWRLRRWRRWNNPVANEMQTDFAKNDFEPNVILHDTDTNNMHFTYLCSCTRFFRSGSSLFRILWHDSNFATQQGSNANIDNNKIRNIKPFDETCVQIYHSVIHSVTQLVRDFTCMILCGTVTREWYSILKDNAFEILFVERLYTVLAIVKKTSWLAMPLKGVRCR